MRLLLSQMMELQSSLCVLYGKKMTNRPCLMKAGLCKPKEVRCYGGKSYLSINTNPKVIVESDVACFCWGLGCRYFHFPSIYYHLSKKQRRTGSNQSQTCLLIFPAWINKIHLNLPHELFAPVQGNRQCFHYCIHLPIPTLLLLSPHGDDIVPLCQSVSHSMQSQSIAEPSFLPP